jgi:hypothetical protein
MSVEPPAVDATPYLAPYESGRVRRPVHLLQTPGSYAVEPAAEDSWLAIAFRAFSRLAGQIEVRDLLIVGTGNGLDALGAIEIFDLRSLMATDLLEENVSVARRNVLAHLAEAGEIELGFCAGDLLSCVPRERRFCLMYENLPNIRAPAGMSVDAAPVAGRYFRAAELGVPEPFETYLLALHYECLRQARAYLREAGGALTALGGRIPLEVAFDLHRACGYQPELVAYDLKLQSEPDLVLPGYSTAEERHGVEFMFYAADAVDVVAEARRSGLDGYELFRAAEPRVRECAMSAREAMRRHRRGEAVAHSVLMIFGQRVAKS